METSDIPVNLHDSHGQARLKNFSWRVTEELAEALDAAENDEDPAHFGEELGDALHFLVELAILSGITPQNIYDAAPDITNMETLWKFRESQTRFSGPEAFTNFMIKLGMACNTLKNKPWKVSHMLTDEQEYRKRFVEAFHRFVDICVAYGLNPEDMFDLYCRKNTVNQFRISSKY